MRKDNKTNQIQASERAENPTGESLCETGGSSRKQELSLEYMKIAKWLGKLRFQKKFFGGVSEQNVWKKISELNAMYEDALTAERIRYDTLIEHYKKDCIQTETGEDEFESTIDDINENEVKGIDNKYFNGKVIEHRKRRR